MSARAGAGHVRVGVADDHPMLRTIVRLACEDHDELEIVGEAATGREAVAMCLALRPDVLVLDLSLPELDGFGVVEELRRAGLPTRILVLSERDDAGSVLRAMQLGVDGYLDKSGDIEAIAGALLTVAGGGRAFAAAQHERALDGLADVVRRSRERAAAILTPREADVLRMIAGGLTTRQIGSRLEMSPRTVESHIGNLYRKLGVGTRVQAVARGSELGLL